MSYIIIMFRRLQTWTTLFLLIPRLGRKIKNLANSINQFVIIPAIMINRNTRIFPHLYFSRISISFRNASGFELRFYTHTKCLQLWNTLRMTCKFVLRVFPSLRERLSRHLRDHKWPSTLKRPKPSVLKCTSRHWLLFCFLLFLSNTFLRF